MSETVHLRVRGTSGTFLGTRIETSDGQLVEGITAAVIRIGPFEEAMNRVTIELEAVDVDLAAEAMGDLDWLVPVGGGKPGPVDPSAPVGSDLRCNCLLRGDAEAEF